ncbi:SIS domain-containing protein [Mesoaciditoga lauensis]|uniref:SIS domain-containing protein n=1 Tax=Mesoaciditoga lauensis TaxID=1495039 RepID=UPI0005682636|nr:SIS domain-containing protein [Mesoaciditoga lauensis]
MSNFEEEIKEQPGALQRFLNSISSLRKTLLRIASFHPIRIAFFGMGSSLYATIPAVYLLRSAGISANYYDASEALWYIPQKWFDNIDMCVFVSQSGETIEIRKLLDKIRNSKVLKVGITANTKSYVANNCDEVIDIFTGKERALGSTKTHMNSVVASLVLSMFLANSEGQVKHLMKLPSIVNDSILRASSTVEDLFKKIDVNKFNDSVITSRGFLLGEVYQSALTLNEISRVSALAISTGMLKHGPMEIFSERRGITCFVPSSSVRTLLIKFCQSIVSHVDFIWIMSNGALDIELSPHLFKVETNFDLPEYLQGLIFLPYIQILAYRIRKMKNLEDDEFYFIKKVTTEE